MKVVLCKYKNLPEEYFTKLAFFISRRGINVEVSETPDTSCKTAAKTIVCIHTEDTASIGKVASFSDDENVWFVPSEGNLEEDQEELLRAIYSSNKKEAAVSDEKEASKEAVMGLKQVARELFTPIKGAGGEDIEPIMNFAAVKRDSIRENAVSQLMKTFPIKQGKYSLELEDAWVDETDSTPTMERKARLEGETLYERIRGNVVLKDENGKVIEKKNDYTLAKLPYFTDDHSFLIKGTPYAPRNQLRTRSGVYTRIRGNNEIEASFNLEKGANFRISLDPEKGIFYMEFGTSKIPLYPILKAMNFSDQLLEKEWGKELVSLNASTDRTRSSSVNKLYEKVIPSFARTHNNDNDKIKAIQGYFDSTKMDGDVNRRTLGQEFDKLTPESLVTASKKVVGVYKGSVSPDDRDSLAYQRVYGIEDFVAEKIKLDSKDITKKIQTKIRFPKAGGPSIKNLLPPDTFGRGVQNFITTSSIVTTQTGINPMERIDSTASITRLGEGAIGTERAVPMEARRLHGTHLGILGPLRTPESSRAGIDVKTALHAARDKNGILYAPVKNLQTNKVEYRKIDELENEPIAFPEQETSKGNIDVLFKGKTSKMKPGEVKYQIPHVHSQFSIAENMAPMVEGMQGNRTIMSSKMVTQALPLVHAEPPLVSASAPEGSPYKTMEEQAAAMIEAFSPVNGEVTKIDEDFIYIKSDSSGKIIKMPYKQDVPYSKTRFNQKVKVKVGDKVTPNQQLTESNFTRDNKLSLGTNMVTAYIADHGYNTDDAITISESAAKKLTSEHFYTEKLMLDAGVKTGARVHATHCPNIFTQAQYSVLDDNGVVKKGHKIKYGEPLIAAVKRAELSIEDKQLGKLHNTLVKNYLDASIVWDREVEGLVKDVITTPTHITVTVLTQEPARRGDKIAGTYGNKGIIGRIVPDENMLKNEEGKPIDILFTSAGVISRINPAQITASALGKVAAKQGSPIVVKNFDNSVKSNVQMVRERLKEAGLKDKETVTDPVTGRKIDNIFVGQNYIMKLFKTTESNFAARNIGGYDSLEQPLKGGERASKSTGGLEVNALLAHNARSYMSDVANIKSQQNAEYWRSVQLGYPPPSPVKNVAFTKFLGMLKGSGIKIEERPDSLVMAPMTDKDVEAMSSGEIENEKRVRSKDLRPEQGGLFDEAVTGGLNGKKWSHVNLTEPIVNPVFFEPARRLLGKTQKEMDEMIKNTPGDKIREQLNSIDVGSKLAELNKIVRVTNGTKRDDAVKQIKFLRSLQENGMKAGEAYTLSKFPVLPPVMRPLVPAGNGSDTLIVDSSNFLYRDLLLSKRKMQELKDIPGLPQEFIAAERKQIFDAMKAVAGIGDPISPQSKSRDATGFIKNIAGTNPKSGFFQKKVVKRKMDLSGSATVSLNPNLGVDEIDVPEDLAWGTYKPFVVKNLVSSGMNRLDAMKEVENKTPLARNALVKETQERPMIINRAPTLHRWGMLGVKPNLIQGKTIGVNPFLTKPMNMDFDGDVAILSVPVTDAGKQDVKNMMLSKHLFSDQRRGDLMVGPAQESIIGWTKATEGKPENTKPIVFERMSDAVAAYRRGEIKESTLVEIKNK